MHTDASTIPNAKTDGVRTIEPELLLHWLAGRRVLVLDVRESAEMADSGRRIAGARHIPVHQLFVRRNELPSGKVAAVVTVSNEGVRSHAAAFTLSLLGFTDVRSLAGGLDAWARMGLPLE